MGTDSTALEAAIETALWYLDSSGDNPNAWLAANCYSLVGGAECEAPLIQAIEALRATGLKPRNPQGDAALVAANVNVR